MHECINFDFLQSIALRQSECTGMSSGNILFCHQSMLYFMLLLTSCEVHMGKYLDRSFEVQTE